MPPGRYVRSAARPAGTTRAYDGDGAPCVRRRPSRLWSLVAVAVVVPGLLAAPALAAPVGTPPSPAEVEAQRGEASALRELAQAEAGRSEEARAQLLRLADGASAALERLYLAQAAERDARSEADAARSQAVTARESAARAREHEAAAREELVRITAETEAARADLGRYASAAYRAGSTPDLAAASSLLESGSPTELGRRLSTVEWVGDRHARAVDRLDRAQTRQDALTRDAASAATDAVDAEARATAAEQVAVAAEATAVAANAAAVAARAEADALVASQQALILSLDAAARATSDAATTASAEAERMDRAVAFAAAERLAGERQREVDVAAGRAVIPQGECQGGTGVYRNGEIPRSVLCPLVGTRGHVARADAASAFNALSAEYARTFGRYVCVTDSYRSLEMQTALKAAKPRLAARPGTSNHGWAVAVDLCDGVDDVSSATHRWLQLNAPRFGWFNPSWARPGGSKPEPWHWEYAG